MAEGKENSHPVGEWSSQVYRLSDFLEYFQLPQVAKVREGYHDENEEKTLSFDDVLLLHKHVTIPKVIAISSQAGEEWGHVSLPLACAVKVDRVPEEFAKTRLSSGGILEQLSKVRFVRVVESDTEVGLATNDKLKVKYKTVENHGSSFSFLLTSLTKPERIFKVTQNCKATFQAILEPNEYRIAEVVRNFGLPNYVYMVDNDIQDKFKNSYQQAQRVLKLQSTCTETLVLASPLEDPSLVIKLPKNLEITLRSSVEAENQRQIQSRGESSNGTEIEKEQILMSNKADSCVIYEDMGDHVKETEIASQQNDQMKREIKKDAAGKLQVVSPNNYTPTPLARALSSRNGTYDFPKTTSTEKTQESIVSQRTTPLYDIPRRGTRSHSDGSISVALFKNQIDCQEYAPMESFRFSGVSTAAENKESEDEHIYQEITFRELPEEMKTSGSIGRDALNNKDRIFPNNKRKNFSKRDSAPANLKVGELGSTELSQNSNTYQMDRTMADKNKSTRRYQCKTQTGNDEAVYVNCNFLQPRISECHSDYEFCQESQKTSPQRRATTTGVAGLVGSSFGSAINDALLKNNLFAKKAKGSPDVKIPPQPPPRTSSRKPDVPESEYCSTGKDGNASKKKPGHAPLPEPPKTTVKRSASAAATIIGIVKDKTKCPGRPLPVPKPNCQSVVSRYALNEEDTRSSTSKAAPEKPLRQKPVTQPKAHHSPTPVPPKTRFAGSEGQSPLSKDPRDRKSAPLDLKKPAIPPPKPKAYVSTKSESFGAKEHTNLSSAKRNRSQSLDELNTNFDDTDFVIPDDLRSLGVAGVAECLKKLKLDKMVNYFQDNQIDGEMLLSLDDDILSEMGMEKFHRLKLIKFIGGWRPMM